MTKNRKYWKSTARKALSGCWIYGIGGMLVVLGINILGSELASTLFTGDTLVSLIMAGMFLFVFTIVSLIFSTGYNYMLLNLVRKGECSWGDLLAMFHRGTDGILSAGLVISLIQTLVTLPFYYIAYVADPGDTIEMQIIWMETCIGYFLVSQVLSLLFTMPFALVFYVLADEPQLKGMEALKKSMELMKGKLIKYLFLQISFLPLLFLCIFTCGIGLLWLSPYAQTVNAVFYMDAAGEFDESRIYGENDTDAADHIDDVTELPHPDEEETDSGDTNPEHADAPRDDYNAEA